MNSNHLDWWRGAVIYQIYPRSFYDARGDGIGDLKGITQKLDYVAKLGVDGIWISPFFKSPMKDFGYDISDFMDIDPIFGTMADFHALIQEAHQLNLKILIDLVANHTSDQHPWFQESKKSRDNSKADWYVWADPDEKGNPPNNWLSVFGGSAWEWNETRKQYYLHNFLIEQPDLNFHNPEVTQAILTVCKYWLDNGVDGFRLDAVNFYVHDKYLRNNPMRLSNEPLAEGVPKDNPYAHQHHIYDKSRPENLFIISEIRKLLTQYPGTTTIGELGDDYSVFTSADYVSGDDRLHMVYSFRLLEGSLDATFIRNTVETMENYCKAGWLSWSFSNHDVVRAISRWGGKNPTDQFGRLLMTTLLTLRGTLCLYQGEELGLTEADIPYEKIQDPYGIRFYPKFKGRDGCRTPIPWIHNAKNAGFSNAEDTWLPIPNEHLQKAVDLEEKDPKSLLNIFRNFLHWRKKQPALVHGEIKFIETSPFVLAFERNHEKQQLIIFLNLSAEQVTCDLSNYNNYKLIQEKSFNATKENNQLILQPFSAAILEK